MAMCALPQVGYYRGGYRKRLVLLLQARQEITKLCQLITHTATTAQHTEMEKYNINDVGTKMQTVQQRLFVPSALISHPGWSPFIRLLYSRCSFSVCDVL